MNATTRGLDMARPPRVGATIGTVKTMLRWEALLILVGAVVYNVGHSYVSPSILAFLGFVVASPLLYSLALIWIAHIELDRMLGFGLKYASGFDDMHLGFKRQNIDLVHIERRHFGLMSCRRNGTNYSMTQRFRRCGGFANLLAFPAGG
jgi:Domain of unknown function (DUF4260)